MQYQAPLLVVGLNDVIANTANKVYVVAVANQSVYLDELSLTFDAAVATAVITLEDTNGVNAGFISTVVLGPHVVNFHGLALAPGVGFRIRNTAGAAVTIRGKLTYSQY